MTKSITWKVVGLAVSRSLIVSCWRASIVMLGQAADLQHAGGRGADRGVRDGGLALEQFAGGFPGEVDDRVPALVFEQALDAGIVLHLLFEAVFGFNADPGALASLTSMASACFWSASILVLSPSETVPCVLLFFGSLVEVRL